MKHQRTIQKPVVFAHLPKRDKLAYWKGLNQLFGKIEPEISNEHATEGGKFDQCKAIIKK